MQYLGKRFSKNVIYFLSEVQKLAICPVFFWANIAMRSLIQGLQGIA